LTSKGHPLASSFLFLSTDVRSDLYYLDHMIGFLTDVILFCAGCPLAVSN